MVYKLKRKGSWLGNPNTHSLGPEVDERFSIYFFCFGDGKLGFQNSPSTCAMASIVSSWGILPVWSERNHAADIIASAPEG